MIYLFKNKSSEKKSPLKVKYNFIFFALGCVIINYSILPYLRTCQSLYIGTLTGFTLSIFAGAIFHAILIGYYISKGQITSKKILAIWVVVLLPELLIRCFAWQATLISFPDTLCRIMTVLSTCYFFSTPNIRKRILTALFFSIIFFVFLFGWEFWTNKLNFDTFTGKIKKEQIISRIEFDSRDGKLPIELLSGKYTLLYMWITRCGYCYESLPQLQSFYNDSVKYPNIRIYAVHNWTKKENEETGITELEKRGYTFPCLSIYYKDSFLTTSKITVYPTVLILNNKKELLFRGSLDKAIDYIKELVNQKE